MCHHLRRLDSQGKAESRTKCLIEQKPTQWNIEASNTEWNFSAARAMQRGSHCFQSHDFRRKCSSMRQQLTTSMKRHSAKYAEGLLLSNDEMCRWEFKFHVLHFDLTEPGVRECCPVWMCKREEVGRNKIVPVFYTSRCIELCGRNQNINWRPIRNPIQGVLVICWKFARKCFLHLLCVVRLLAHRHTRNPQLPRIRTDCRESICTADRPNQWCN